MSGFIEWRGTEAQQHRERMKACRERREQYPDDECDGDGSCAECEMDMVEALETRASKAARLATPNQEPEAGEGKDG